MAAARWNPKATNSERRAGSQPARKPKGPAGEPALRQPARFPFARSNAVRMRFEKYFCGKPPFHERYWLALRNDWNAAVRYDSSASNAYCEYCEAPRKAQIQPFLGIGHQTGWHSQLAGDGVALNNPGAKTSKQVLQQFIPL